MYSLLAVEAAIIMWIETSDRQTHARKPILALTELAPGNQGPVAAWSLVGVTCRTKLTDH